MLKSLPGKVTVYEVGPRDGLQNEAQQIATQDKVQLIEKLAASGIKHIEITSFVSPKWIPQLADGKEVAEQICASKAKDLHVTALVPNLKGYEQARLSGLKEIALFMSATETHSKKNINKSIDEAIAALKEVADQAKKDGMTLRGYMSVCFVCPYEGQVSEAQVIKACHRLMEIGIDQISLGDTIGAATPNQVQSLIEKLGRDIPLSKIALHCHDTYGMALANVLAGLDSGITCFDSSVGGMGGCPYAPGAAGNLATEDLVYFLNGLGIDTGVDLDKLVSAGEFAQEILQKKLPGRCLQAKLAARQKISCGDK
jgi:hydroxymethylglutaryl-CoA lyase